MDCQHSSKAKNVRPHSLLQDFNTQIEIFYGDNSENFTKLLSDFQHFIQNHSECLVRERTSNPCPKSNYIYAKTYKFISAILHYGCNTCPNDSMWSQGKCLCLFENKHVEDGECVCNLGFVENMDTLECECPELEHLDGESGQCVCNKGYLRNQKSGKCDRSKSL